MSPDLTAEREYRSLTHSGVETALSLSLGKETLLYEVYQNNCRLDRCDRHEQFCSSRTSASSRVRDVEVLRLRTDVPTIVLQANHRSALPPQCLQLPAQLRQIDRL